MLLLTPYTIRVLQQHDQSLWCTIGTPYTIRVLQQHDQSLWCTIGEFKTVAILSHLPAMLSDFHMALNIALYK